MAGCAASESEESDGDEDIADDEDEELGDLDEEALLQEIVALRGQMGDEDASDEDGDSAGEGETAQGRTGGQASTSKRVLTKGFEQQSDDDSSEDERDNRNTVGDIPLKQWYKDEEHIGYDRDGLKLVKVRGVRRLGRSGEWSGGRCR